MPIPPPLDGLALRTLIRGAAVGLATGQQVRDAMGEGPISVAPPEYKTDPWDALHKVGLAQETPLWHYILLEAQLDCVGATLGKMGSRIVAEVIDASLWFDPTSFLRRQGPKWTPEAWTMPDGKLTEIKSLKDVARVAAV
jgi:hypothetical protein